MGLFMLGFVGVCRFLLDFNKTFRRFVFVLDRVV